ncbi:MAG: hypothetical protein RR319_06150 [Bacteroides sp.]
MKGKVVKKEKKKEKAEPTAAKALSEYQLEKGSKQSKSVNPSAK